MLLLAASLYAQTESCAQDTDPHPHITATAAADLIGLGDGCRLPFTLWLGVDVGEGGAVEPSSVVAFAKSPCAQRSPSVLAAHVSARSAGSPGWC